MLRVVLLLSAVLSAGLLSGPVDARSRDRSGRDVPPQEQEQESQREDPQGRERRDDRDDGWKRSRRDSAADAARLATMRNGGGRVLSVEPAGGGSHRVKVIKDGVVRVYVVEGN